MMIGPRLILATLVLCLAVGRWDSSCRSDLFTCASVGQLGTRIFAAEQSAVARLPDRRQQSATKQHDATREENLYDGRSLEYWQQRIGTLDPKSPQSAEAVPGLLALVQDDQLPESVRRQAALTLGRMGAPAREAIPLLIDVLRQSQADDIATVMWAARSLALFGPDAKAAAPALIALVTDENVPLSARQVPIEALARIGTAHADTMPALIELLEYQPADLRKVSPADAVSLRELACDAIALIGPAADVAVPWLVRAVRNPREAESVRRKSLMALAAMQQRAAIAVPAMIEALEFDTSAAARDAAAEALAQVGAAAVPLLQRYLSHPDAEVRWRVAASLGQVGPAAGPALAALENALSDESEQVRIKACEALSKLGANPRVFVPALIEQMTSEDRQIRMQAMRLLLSLRPTPAIAIGRLNQLRQDQRDYVRKIAAKTLDKLNARAD